MTREQLEKAALALVSSHRLISSSDEVRYLPKVFIVNGQCYWFLNAAKRAAFGTNSLITVMTIEQAWQIHTHLHPDTLEKERIEKKFDQTGDTFNGRLFDDRNSPLAEMVNIPIIPLVPTP